MVIMKAHHPAIPIAHLLQVGVVKTRLAPLVMVCLGHIAKTGGGQADPAIGGHTPPLFGNVIDHFGGHILDFPRALPRRGANHLGASGVGVGIGQRARIDHIAAIKRGIAATARWVAVLHFNDQTGGVIGKGDARGVSGRVAQPRHRGGNARRNAAIKVVAHLFQLAGISGYLRLATRPRALDGRRAGVVISDLVAVGIGYRIHMPRKGNKSGCAGVLLAQIPILDVLVRDGIVGQWPPCQTFAIVPQAILQAIPRPHRPIGAIRAIPIRAAVVINQHARAIFHVETGVAPTGWPRLNQPIARAVNRHPKMVYRMGAVGGLAKPCSADANVAQAPASGDGAVTRLAHRPTNPATRVAETQTGLQACPPRRHVNGKAVIRSACKFTGHRGLPRKTPRTRPPTTHPVRKMVGLATNQACVAVQGGGDVAPCARLVGVFVGNVKFPPFLAQVITVLGHIQHKQDGVGEGDGLPLLIYRLEGKFDEGRDAGQVEGAGGWLCGGIKLGERSYGSLANLFHKESAAVGETLLLNIKANGIGQ